MANIKVSELKELKNKITEEVKVFNFNDLEIEIVQYLPITKKIELAAIICGGCIDDDDGLFVVNYTSKDILTVYFITQYYTNINLPKDFTDAYDLLISTGLYDFILENIEDDEWFDVVDIIDNKIITELKKYEQQNTIINIIENALDTIINKIPTTEEAENFIKMAGKEIDQFDKDKLKFLGDFQQWNNGVETDGNKKL